jgi:hypothetical protein
VVLLAMTTQRLKREQSTRAVHHMVCIRLVLLSCDYAAKLLCSMCVFVTAVVVDAMLMLHCTANITKTDDS